MCVFGVTWGLNRSESKVVFTKLPITLAVLQTLLHGVFVLQMLKKTT